MNIEGGIFYVFSNCANTFFGCPFSCVLIISIPILVSIFMLGKLWKLTRHIYYKLDDANYKDQEIIKIAAKKRCKDEKKRE